MSEKKSFAEKALDLDHRIIASIVILIIAYMILKPIAIPFPVSSYTMQYYNYITETIPEGETIGFMLSDSPSTRPQLQPSTVETLAILWEKNCKFVFWYDNVVAGPILPGYIALAEEVIGRTLEYGTDYVNLGYIAGEETGQAAFLKDIRAVTAGVDIDGKNINDMPIMQGINTGGDFNYGFCNTACSATEPIYIRQWQGAYGVNLLTIECSMILPQLTLYLATGQLKGVANGLLGSAEMEYLTGHLGLAYGQTLAVSFGGLYFTIIIILGNVFYFIARAGGRRE